jgi:hypothetical protein
MIIIKNSYEVKARIPRRRSNLFAFISPSKMLSKYEKARP